MDVVDCLMVPASRLQGMATLMLLIGFVLIAVLGAMMYYLSIPAVIQPAHLLLTAVTWMIGVDVLVRSWQSTD